jgi:putative glutamine amidotransferase
MKIDVGFFGKFGQSAEGGFVMRYLAGERKPIIGLNADYRGPAGNGGPKRQEGLLLPRGCFDCIQEAGGIALIMPPVEAEDDAAAVLNLVDGVVLIGGQDLDPRRDGFMLHQSVRMLDQRREKFDRMLAAMIMDRRMPVLGIGVGMQLLNVTAGGLLFLHLPEDCPDAIPHRDLKDPDHRHALNVVPGSFLDPVYGDGEVRVNSRHHMAVDPEKIAPGFFVAGRCPDGVIEAIESEMPDWLAWGVQFHPEDPSASALDKLIFERFIEEVLARMQPEDGPAGLLRRWAAS